MQARETASQGMGLGLAIARGIVERHGGRICAECPEGGGLLLLHRGSAPGARAASTFPRPAAALI